MWLPRIMQDLIEKELGQRVWASPPISDASSRKYFRLNATQSHKTYILMELGEIETEALKSDQYTWVHVREYLHTHGIRVPQILVILPEQGEIILEDLGTNSLQNAIFQAIHDPATQEDLYDDVIRIAHQFTTLQPAPRDGWSHRRFTQEFFLNELLFFWQHQIQPDFCNEVTFDKARFFDEATKFTDQACSPSQWVFTHRDFHSRNLMLFSGKYSVIDFQDARFGPPTYDIVSLAFDPYVPLELRFRLQIVQDFIAAIDTPLRKSVEDTWVVMAIQRIIKALGSYAYLSREKPEFKKHTGPALRVLEQVVRPLGEKFPYLTYEFLPRMMECHEKQITRDSKDRRNDPGRRTGHSS